MAITPGSYSFSGGVVLGNDGGKQFVLTRSDMATAFTDEEYNQCINALINELAVAVSFGAINGVVCQAQLASKTNLGALTFSYTRKEKVESWTVAATSPHTITHDDYDVDNDITPFVNAGTKIAEGTVNGQQFELFAPSYSDSQFMLVRSDMIADFTNEEYQACVDAVIARKAVCVQYGSNQVQLAAVAGGALYFSGCSLTENFQYVVSPARGNHTITRTSAPIGCGTKVFEVSYSTSINDYVYPTYAEVSAAVLANKVPVILRHIHDTPVRQCFVFKSLSSDYINFENNEMYIRISNSDTVEYGYINDRNLAAGYDPSATYALGDYCMYQNVLYTCTTAIPSGEPWRPSHWAGTSVSEQIGNVEALLAAL